MVICIQTSNVPTKERDFANTVLSIRLTEPEAVRFWVIMDAAKSRNPYTGKSDVCRELLGLTKPQALTLQEIEFFRTGKRRGIPFGRIHLKEEQEITGKKRKSG